MDFFVDSDISKAKTISTDFYSDKEVFEIAREKIFASSWQYVGDAGSVKKNGDVFPFTLLENFLDEPLVVTKNNSGELNCLSNVCTHRGNIIATERCNAAHLRCKYHGRLFSLDGKFTSMPEFKEVKNFPSADDDLTRISFRQWGNLFFAALNPKFPFEVFFKEMLDRVGWMPFDKFVFRPELSKDYFIDAHWALYCENYLEGFHIPFVHEGLNTVIDFGNYTTELFRYSNLQLGIAKQGKDICFDLPPSSPDFGKNIAAYYFFVFPNMMFNFYPWGLSLNIVSPLGIGKTKVSFLNFVWDESKRDKGAGTGLHDVEMEDEEVVQNVQRGVRSRFYNHGRYSVTREQGTHHFHQIISEFMK